MFRLFFMLLSSFSCTSSLGARGGGPLPKSCGRCAPGAGLATICENTRFSQKGYLWAKGATGLGMVSFGLLSWRKSLIMAFVEAYGSTHGWSVFLDVRCHFILGGELCK